MIEHFTDGMQAQGNGRHVRQTGGKGQYGHAVLQLEPLGRGTGFEFESKVVGGAVPREYWKAIEEGVRDAFAGGIVATAQPKGKIGLLVLNDGMWQGRQIVPAEWIRLSTRPHVVESEYYDYGYQWWYRSNDKKPWWKERSVQVSKEPDLFTAMGAGGQFITVIRERNMVVVTTASDYGEHDDWLSKIPMIVERIVPALSKGN